MILKDRIMQNHAFYVVKKQKHIIEVGYIVYLFIQY